MAFDGLFTAKMISELNILINGKINKINQCSKYDFIFTIRSNFKNHNLLISMNPDSSRIQLTMKNYEAMQEPPMLQMLLRKHLDGGIIREIIQHNTDRVVTFKIDVVDELGFLKQKDLIAEITGRHCNLILKKDNIIIDSFKRVSPFDNSSRTIFPNAIYEFPKDTKLNTLSLDKFDSDLNNYQGLSKLVINNILNTNTSLENIINSFSPVLIESNKKIFYFTDLLYYPGKRTFFDSLSLLLDYFYYDESVKNRIKQQTSNLSGFINKEINHLKNKINKLTLELNSAYDCEIYKIKGELIISNLFNIKQGMSKIKVMNYYDSKEIEITLDPLLDGVKNANRYYTKYRKLKKSIIHLTEQIEISNNELEYFKLLEAQLEIASLNDALEIKEELIQNNYLKDNNPKKKKKKINILTYKVDNSTIYVGKNNIQNDYLTNKFSNSNDMWFHVKDAPGSHVILRGELTENTIRTASNVAAFYSKYRNSSSVAVDYTLIKHVKKIPGLRNCFVRITNQKTIYIDPSYEMIESLEKIK